MRLVIVQLDSYVWMLPQGQEARDAGVSDVCRLLAAPEDLARLQQLRAEVGAPCQQTVVLQPLQSVVL